MMGGDITVASEPNKGSTFSVKLPADVNLQDSSRLKGENSDFDPHDIRFNNELQQSKPPSERRCRVAKVLIIDDDLHIRNLLSTALNKLGFDTLPAASGQLGITMARQHRPDAIVLEVLMPDMDGWKVLKILKNNLNTAAIPVVLLTANDEEGLGYALGAKFFLRKPLNLYFLEQAVKSCVRQSEWQEEKIFAKSAR